MAKKLKENSADASPKTPKGKKGLAVLVGLGLVAGTAAIKASVRSPRNEKEYQILIKPMVADMIETINHEYSGSIEKAVIKEYKLDIPHSLYGKYIMLAAYPKEGNRYFIEDTIRGIVYRSPKEANARKAGE